MYIYGMHNAGAAAAHHQSVSSCSLSANAQGASPTPADDGVIDAEYEEKAS